jgi:hypothetical protein
MIRLESTVPIIIWVMVIPKRKHSVFVCVKPGLLEIESRGQDTG